MYYTTGSYRKSKMFIDYANIVLTAGICVVFILLLFFRSKLACLFPVIFYMGALMNGLTAAKNFMNKKKASGIVLTVVAVVLLVMGTFSLAIITR